MEGLGRVYGNIAPTPEQVSGEARTLCKEMHAIEDATRHG